MHPNRSIPSAQVVPVLVYPDVRHVQVAPSGGVVTASVMLRVDDIDALCARARERGGRVIEEPTDFPYGERQCRIEDPFGHYWTLSQTFADVHPDEWGGQLYEA